MVSFMIEDTLIFSHGINSIVIMGCWDSRTLSNHNHVVITFCAFEQLPTELHTPQAYNTPNSFLKNLTAQNNLEPNVTYLSAIFCTSQLYIQCFKLFFFPSTGFVHLQAFKIQGLSRSKMHDFQGLTTTQKVDTSRVDKQRNEPGRWKSRIVAIFLLFLTLLHVLT